MKLKLIMVGLIVILAVSFLACSPAKEISKEVSIDEFMQGKNISWIITGVSVGDTIKATLGSNPTTGFNWQLAVISDETVLKQEGESQFVPPAEVIPGAGGKEIWTFKVLKKGTSTVSMEYSRPWEGGEKAEWTFDIDVTVE